MPNYINIAKDEDYISLSFFIDDDKIFAYGKKINEINE